jgi:hypothetical protein
MNPRPTPALLLLLLTGLLFSCDDPQNEPEITGAQGSPSKEDIVDVTDLLVGDTSGAGAAVIGDPAELLGAARKESTEGLARLRAVLQRLQGVAAGRDPERRGLASSRPYGVWSGTVDGVEVRHTVTVLAPDRMRYLMQARKAGDQGSFRPILTGIFLKKSPTKGGGRLHMNLTNLSDLGGASADGQLQLWWANDRPGTTARRLLYRGVKDRSGPYPDARNYGTDYLREAGVRGVYRALVVGDLVPKLAGNEALALRMSWTPGQGGRADTLLVGGQSNATVRSSECWDSEGKRTAHRNDAAFDDAENPDEGDVSSCWGYPQQKAPDAPVYEAVDTAPEVEEALSAVGATTVPEADATDATDPEG